MKILASFTHVIPWFFYSQKQEKKRFSKMFLQWKLSSKKDTHKNNKIHHSTPISLAAGYIQTKHIIMIWMFANENSELQKTYYYKLCNHCHSAFCYPFLECNSFCTHSLIVQVALQRNHMMIWVFANVNEIWDCMVSEEYIAQKLSITCVFVVFLTS